MKIKTKTKKRLLIFSSLAILIIAITIFAPLITGDPYEANMLDSLNKPSKEHWFGTDKLGRDLFSRVIYGGRYSLAMTFVVTLLVFLVGGLVGITAGIYGGFVDNLLMRLSDIMMSFPNLILATAIAGILGPSITNTILAISAVTWPKYARLTRSMTLQLKKAPFVEAAFTMGASRWTVIKKHILPNVFSQLIITLATDIGGMLLEISSLSFLGFGAQPPTPEWGLMVSEGRSYIIKAPWLIVYPGLAIMLVVIVFNLLGDTIRDYFDPNLQEK